MRKISWFGYNTVLVAILTHRDLTSHEKMAGFGRNKKRKNMPRLSHMSTSDVSVVCRNVNCSHYILETEPKLALEPHCLKLKATDHAASFNNMFVVSVSSDQHSEGCDRYPSASECADMHMPFISVTIFNRCSR